LALKHQPFRLQKLLLSGELCIYLAFAALSMHPLPFVLFGAVIAVEWVPNMRRKDKSLSRYPDFAAYKARSGLLFPRA
jgi:hypothetical protein